MAGVILRVIIPHAFARIRPLPGPKYSCQAFGAMIRVFDSRLTPSATLVSVMSLPLINGMPKRTNDRGHKKITHANALPVVWRVGHSSSSYLSSIEWTTICLIST